MDKYKQYEIFLLKEEQEFFYINKFYQYKNKDHISLLPLDKNSNIFYTYKLDDFEKDLLKKQIIRTNKFYNQNYKIIKNTEYELIDNDIDNNRIEDYRQKYESKYRAKDGHYVRSRAEVIIDNWLYDNNILHEYEKRITDKNTNKHIHCDFYIKNKDLYIEYYGLDTEDYNNTIEYKRKIYKSNNLKCIELFDYDLEHIEDVLEDKITNKK